LLTVVTLALQFGIIKGEQLVREPQDVGLLLAGNAEHVGHDAQWVRGGHISGEVALTLAALAGQFIDEFPCASLYLLVERSDRKWSEHRARHLAHSTVLRWIHLDYHPHGAERARVRRLPLALGEHRDSGSEMNRPGWVEISQMSACFVIAQKGSKPSGSQ
jgi:hypothetical protein